MRFVFGDTLFAIRILPALRGTAVLFLAALIVRELGGGRLAQAVALLPLLLSPLFLRSASLFQPVVFDQLWWSLALRSRQSWRAARHVVPVAVLSAFVLTACGDSTGPVHDGPEPAINFQRLVVADAEAATARVIALNNDQVVQTFNLTEPSSRVYRSHSGRIVGINQRTAGRVNFVDAACGRTTATLTGRTPLFSPSR